MTCKDCYHYDACKEKFAGLKKLCVEKPEKHTELDPQVENRCQQFKDKSLIVELPCKVGDIFFIIAQRFEKGKYTDFFIDERQISCFEYDGKSLTIYDFDEIRFALDDIYFDKSKAEARLKELEEND
nr:MAG TPA: hypothetical protein [Caudoviricetes sp.]